MPIKRDDLKDTILPKISIDEYEPKVGTVDEIIVVAFFAIDEDPAKDLDDFLEKGPYELYDVDVSPNPNEDGHYLVFLEFKRADSFFVKFEEVLEDVENVTGKMKWTMMSPNIDGEVPLDVDVLRGVIVTEPVPKEPKIKEPKPAPEETVESFLQSAGLVNVLKEAVNTGTRLYTKLTLRDALCEMELLLVDLNTTDIIVEKYKINTVPTNLLYQPYEVRKLRSMLGSGWHVTDLNENIAIHNDWTDKILLVRTL